MRGYLNDPRISGQSKAFHFGIDIAAPNGTAVYAVEAGTVHLEDPRAISVAAGDDEFGYWHVVPAVRHHQEVARHELLGHIDAPWLHVHFAERRAGTYQNPLRAGALTPWEDSTRPKVTRVTFSRNGAELSPDAIHGGVDVIAESHDAPPVPVPAPWNDLPVTPARLRWRVLRNAEVVAPGTRLSTSGRRSYRSPPSTGSTHPVPGRTTPTRPASTASTSPIHGARPCSRTAATSSRSRRSISPATSEHEPNRLPSRTTSRLERDACADAHDVADNRGGSMSDKDEFLAWTQSQLRDAETALHNGDPGPRLAIWSSREPVSVLGAWRSAIGRENVRELFQSLAETFSGCRSHSYQIVAAEVIGDVAFTAGYERTQASINGEPRTYVLRVTQVYRREDGEWRVAHRHGDTAESSSNDSPSSALAD